MSISRNGFQGFVNTINPPGIVGGMASQNPRATVLNGKAGSYRADAGVRVGYFARFNPATGLAYGDLNGAGILGFVANESQTIITDFLASYRETIQTGLPVTGYARGDFWALVAGAAVAGDAVYAVLATGQPTIDPAGSTNPDTGYIVAETKEVDATSSAATVAAATGVLTIGGSVAGTWAAGMNVTGTDVPANLFIQGQISGTPGGAGTYQLNYAGPAITSFAATGSFGKLVKITRGAY